MLRWWTYDLAREQSPTPEHLLALLRHTQEAGYTGWGLYLEHRFAYPSTPWAHGLGALQPDTVRLLQREAGDLAVVPFINLLGHMEGLLRTEHGGRYAEARGQGMQACPSNPEFVHLAEAMLDDVLHTFTSEIIHLGGDETKQLGDCPTCGLRVEHAQRQGRDGKAALWGEHFAHMARKVLDAGRRPAVWGDMLLNHPEAGSLLPRSTLVFNWQYFDDPSPTTGQLQAMGFDVVQCPTLHTYNAPWLHLAPSSENARQHEGGGVGQCLTTWEGALLGSYETLLPAIGAYGRRELNYRSAYAPHEEWAKLMGEDLPGLGGAFAYSPIRSGPRCRLLLMGNPFLLWRHHRDEWVGERGDGALALLERAVHVAPDAAYRGVVEGVQAAIQFVRHAEEARQAYASGLPGLAASCLAPCRQVFENLERTATALHHRMGGSRADIERCRQARSQVELVLRRIRDYGDGSLGYLPEFDTLCHPQFTPHDQGNWWQVNAWANG